MIVRPLTRSLLRSFSIQASWNFETIIGYGFAFALLPILRSVYGSDGAELRAAVARHSRLFNSHPYLSPLALAAVARLEVERQPPELVERFKSALRGALGGLGDRVVWAGWRPCCVMVALIALLAGAPWWLAVGGFLLLYNAGHLALRWWSFRVGWREGLGVAARLRASWLWQAERRLHQVGPFLAGVLLALLIGAAVEAGAAPGRTPWPAIGLASAVLIGIGVGPGVRRWAEGGLAAAVLVGLTLGAWPA